MDRFSALQAFIHVGESGSFSKAAERMALSKSMVSRLVSGIEADLGVRLLQRTTRSVTLTEAGRDYFERCRRILGDLDEADLQVSRLQSEPRGLLRISAPVSFGITHLAPALPDFYRRYGEISLDVSMSDRFVDLVEEEFDVAVRIGRLGDSSLVARRLCPIRMVAAASPDYLKRKGTPIAPADLASHECLMGSAASPGWQMSTGMVPVSGRFKVNNGNMVRSMAVAGCGLAFLPTFFLGEDVRAGRLVPVLEEYMPQDTAMYAVYPHGRHLSPKVRAFVDFLADRFGPVPYWDEGLSFP